MVAHATSKKRKRGGKIKLKAPINRNLKVYKSITNVNVKKLYNQSKNPAENLKALGLDANPNHYKHRSGAGDPYKADHTAAFVGMALIPTGSGVVEPNPKRKIISEFDIEYVQRLIEKYSDNYKAMERDIELNYFQHTEQKMKKLCMKYLKATGVADA